MIYLGRVSVTPQADDKHTGWFYVAVCLTFMIGSFMQRLCELAWPNRGGSIAAVPLVGLMMISEVLYLITDWQYHEQVLRWTVVFVSPLFGVVSAACSTGPDGHTHDHGHRAYLERHPDCGSTPLWREDHSGHVEEVHDEHHGHWWNSGRGLHRQFSPDEHKEPYSVVSNANRDLHPLVVA